MPPRRGFERYGLLTPTENLFALENHSVGLHLIESFGMNRPKELRHGVQFTPGLAISRSGSLSELIQAAWAPQHP